METTTPKTFVFVLMPFKHEFDDIYELGIKSACKDTGAYCERVDEQVFDGSILDRVYNQIAKADIIISDLSERNPNVFFETGYAYALGKQVILLTQNADDIPFDLKHYPHIVYENKITKLKTELQKRVAWFIENPKESLSQVEFHLQIYFSGKLLEKNENLEIPVAKSEELPKITRRGRVKLQFPLKLVKLDIYNPTTKVYDGKHYRIGIITSEIFHSNLKTKGFSKLPDGRFIHMLDEIGKVFPYGWESLDIALLPSYYANLKGKKEEIVIRVFTELGMQDFPITLLIES